MKILFPLMICSVLSVFTINAQAIADASAVIMDEDGIQIIKDYKQISSFEELVKPFEGKVVYVDIWATWCGPCRQQFNYKEGLHEYAKDKDIVFLYISVDKPAYESKWNQFIADYKIKGHHALAHPDLKEDLVRNFYAGVKRGRKYLSLPTFIIVDKKGKIVNADAPRPSDGKRLYNKLDKALKK